MADCIHDVQKAARDRVILNTPCPDTYHGHVRPCGAKAGEQCRGMRGAPVKYTHVVRREAAVDRVVAATHCPTCKKNPGEPCYPNTDRVHGARYVVMENLDG